MLPTKVKLSIMLTCFSNVFRFASSWITIMFLVCQISWILLSFMLAFIPLFCLREALISGLRRSSMLLQSHLIIFLLIWIHLRLFRRKEKLSLEDRVFLSIAPKDEATHFIGFFHHERICLFYSIWS
jgi:hypothetical protein